MLEQRGSRYEGNAWADIAQSIKREVLRIIAVKTKLKIGGVSFIVNHADSEDTTYFIIVSNVSSIHGSEAEMHDVDFQLLRGEIESKMLELDGPSTLATR
jgi:hypothetical protein